MAYTIKSLQMGIDKLDDVILAALNKRYELCIQLNEEKQKLNYQVKDSVREKLIIDRLAKNEKYPNMVATVWPTIMNFSKTLSE